MIANQNFFRQDVLVDGEHFRNCQFTECRIVFRATAPVEFEECVFTQCEWVFDGPAKQTLFYLSALATSLGVDAREMVADLLNGILSGEFGSGAKKTQPPVAV
jgi:hypothetical protein